MNTNQEIQEMPKIEFVKLDAHPEYEMSKTFPFVIRKISDRNILSQSINNAGYIQIHLNGDTTSLHRIIAEQFIPNDDPDTKTDIDHKNGNKLDNRIENLEWIPHAENLKRRAKYNHQKSEYIDSLEGLTIVELTEYNNEKLDRYFYDKTNEKLYLKTRAKRNKDGTKKFHYKLVKPCYHNNLDIITLLTVDNKCKSYGYNKLMKHLKTL